jgi:hypothetical protein
MESTDLPFAQHIGLAHTAALVEKVTLHYRDNTTIAWDDDTPPIVEDFIEFFSAQPLNGGGDTWVTGKTMSCVNGFKELYERIGINMHGVEETKGDECAESPYDVLCKHIQTELSLSDEKMTSIRRYIEFASVEKFDKYFANYLPEYNVTPSKMPVVGWEKRFDLNILEHTCNSRISRHTPEFVICYNLFTRLVQEYLNIISDERVIALLTSKNIDPREFHVMIIYHNPIVHKVILEITEIFPEMKTILSNYIIFIRSVYYNTESSFKQYLRKNYNCDFKMARHVAQESGYAPPSYNPIEIIFEAIFLKPKMEDIRMSEKEIFAKNPYLLGIVLQRIALHINDLILYHELYFSATTLVADVFSKSVFYSI